MIRHIVVAKFKPSIPQAEQKTILEDLLTLPGHIKEIKTYELGFDIVQSDRSYDFGLVGTFENLEDLRIYVDHPLHMAVATRLRSASAHMVVVDFEI